MDKLFKLLKFNKTRAIVSTILSFILSVSLAFLSSYNSNLICRMANLYGFVRTVSSSDDDYCYSHFMAVKDDYQSCRNELRRIDREFDLMTRKGCSAFLSCSEKNGEKSNYSIIVEEENLNYTTGVITIDYLCYDLRQNGCYHGIPFKPYFTDSYFREKNISCDINYDYEQTRNGGSYITDSFANQLLLHFRLSSYEELLGRTYSINKNGNSRTYTINNIIATSSEGGKSVFDYFGDFVVTNDSDVFNEESCSIYLGISSDIFLCYDLMNYFEKSNHDLLSLELKENNQWVESSILLNIKNDISLHKQWSLNILETLLMILSLICLAFSVLSLSWLVKNGGLSLKPFYVCESCIFIILLTFNLLFLLLPTSIIFLRIINFFVLIPLEFALFCLLYFIIRRLEERKSEN